MKKFIALFATGTPVTGYQEERVIEEDQSKAAFTRRAKATAKQNGWRLVCVDEYQETPETLPVD